MAFVVLDTLSLPADPDKANEDAFAADEGAAVVLDGATGLGDNLLPGPSDAAWIAHFGARRLMGHRHDGDPSLDALRHALADTAKSFEGLRRRAPIERWEIPYASMMFVTANESGFDALWFGDCAALVARPGAAVEIVGEAFDRRAAEAGRVKLLAHVKGLAPTAGHLRAEYLPHLRAARNKVNTRAGGWLFSPDAHAAAHAASKGVAARSGTMILLATDGFLALASDYGAYDAQGLMEASQAKGLAALGREIRAVEEEDADGHRFPRFKKTDDATAVLLRIA